MMFPEEDYPCVGVCLVDADSGYCLGCGRPPQPVALSSMEGLETGMRPELEPDDNQSSDESEKTSSEA